jgi:magnesium transporter
MAVFRSENLDELVLNALEAEDYELVRSLLADEYAQDIADILERLDEEARYRVFELLEPDLAAEVLDEAGLYTTRQILRELPAERIVALMSRMPLDDVVELLAEDIRERQDELLSAMPPEMAKEVTDALNYPPNSAGRLMTRKFARISGEMTVGQTLAYARQINAKVETLNNFYVLNGGGTLAGVISLREIATLPADRRIGDVMEREVISVTPDVDQEQAARTLARYDFLAMPVVTPEGRMLGIITIDDATDVLTTENTEDILKFGGVTLTNEVEDQPYFTMPIFKVIRQRFVWLLLLFLADTLTGNVLRIFEDELAAVVALSFYIPLLIGTGGNTGAQTVSTIIRGMAVQDIRQRDTLRVLQRELMSGLMLGSALGLVGGIRAYLWDQDTQLALVVGVTLVIVCAWANTIGSLIPLAAKRVGIDPAVVSAPLITTLVDATGLFIYLTIARVLLGL